MFSLPNLISILRLLLAPWVCYLLWTGDYEWVLWLFAVAALTDFLDGWLARRMKLESPFGAMLDPIADKVLLSGVFVTMAITTAIPRWLAAIVLGRDLLILLAAGVLLAIGAKRSFPPSLWGKLSTVLQIAYILAVVMAKSGIAVDVLVPAAAAMVVVLTLVSGADYARRIAAKSS